MQIVLTKVLQNKVHIYAIFKSAYIANVKKKSILLVKCKIYKNIKIHISLRYTLTQTYKDDMV